MSLDCGLSKIRDLIERNMNRLVYRLRKSAETAPQHNSSRQRLVILRAYVFRGLDGLVITHRKTNIKGYHKRAGDQGLQPPVSDSAAVNFLFDTGCLALLEHARGQ